ncbi:hypothetical protein C8F01DRAFT_1091996 [Mycena amicta]|nr:hypothetical protein C8F01DRAFT_1091996 [Mycena amicta]
MVIETFYTGLLYPTAGRPIFVEVPLRLGLTKARSPYDLDFTWWIGTGNTVKVSSIDLDNCSLTLHRWPLDDPKPLKHSHTLFCAPQNAADCRSSNTAQPPNEYINSVTELQGKGWRTKYAMGVGQMSEKDIYTTNAIVRCIWLDLLRFLPWQEFVAVAHTCRKLCKMARVILYFRLCARLGRILLGDEGSISEYSQATLAFLHRLQSSNTVVAGSIPLALLTLTWATDATVQVDNVNILVNVDLVHIWYQYLLELAGFNWTTPPRLRAEYKDHVRSFACLRRQNMTITISGTTSHSLLPTLFAGRNTSQMNIMTWNCVYSFYPKLTCEKRALPGWCTKAVPSYFQAHIVNGPAPLGCVTLLRDSSALMRPCGGECPRILRCVEGLRGVGRFNFGDADDSSDFGRHVFFGGCTRLARMKRAHSRVPVDLFSSLLFPTLLAYAVCSRQTRFAVQNIFRHRTEILLHGYGIPDALRRPFWTKLATCNGGLTGSALLWIAEPQPVWLPSDLNIVVGRGGTKTLLPLFEGLGYVAHTTPSRLPRVVPHPNVAPILSYPTTSIWSSTTTHLRSFASQVITISETVDEFPVRLLVEAEHTLQAGLLTASAFILLYPSQFIHRQAILRGGGVHRRSLFDRPIRQDVMRHRGVHVHRTFYAWYRIPCPRDRCAGLLRRFRGGRGILWFQWSEKHWVDTLIHHCMNRFEDGRFAFTWSWGTCENYRCPFFHQPRDLLVQGTFTEKDEVHPKLASIRCKIDAVHRSIPRFSKVYHGYLFATSCSTPIIVPVPLDHHAKDYQTIDDLRTYTWIAARPNDCPKIPMFLPPTISTIDVQRRNLLLFPARQLFRRVIHGDVLVVCFDQDAIVGPSRFSLSECSDAIQRWWTSEPSFDAAHNFPSRKTPF